jgi:hypothetical protein
MPRGIKIKKSKSNAVSQNDMNLLNDMFGQMTGNSNADTVIIIPKYMNLLDNINKYIKIYNLFLNFKDFVNSFPDLESNFNEIKIFIEQLTDIKNKYHIDIGDYKTIKSDEINLKYKQLKKEKLMQIIIVTSGNLNKYKSNLEDKDNLKDDFIKREPGLSLTPLKFSRLDLKMIWASSKLSFIAKKFILNILSHTLLIGINLYNIINSPDIDIKEFSKILIDSINKMKKEIPRCDKAFDIIANSVNLLETNFDGYYKSSVEAENPSIIIENFIVDVSMSQNATPSVTNQFRKIIMFMKRKTAGNKDPRVAQLFKVLNSQFDMASDNNDEVDDDNDNNEDNNNDKVGDDGDDGAGDDGDGEDNNNDEVGDDGDGDGCLTVAN